MHPNMAEDIVKKYTSADMFPSSQPCSFKLEVIQHFVSDVQELIKQNNNPDILYWKQQAVAIANYILHVLLKQLWYIALKDPLRKDVTLLEVTEYFLSEEVCGLMRQLLGLTGGSICVLDELIKTADISINLRQCPFENDPAMNHVVVLVSFLSKILLDDKGQCQLCEEDRSGAIVKVLKYTQQSSGLTAFGINSYHGNQDNDQSMCTVPSEKMDSMLVKVIGPMLPFESAKSINMPSSGCKLDMYTALHFSGCLHLLNVTKLLLSHPDIDVNKHVISSNWFRPLRAVVSQIGQKYYSYKNCLCVVKCFLEHEKILLYDDIRQDINRLTLILDDIQIHVGPIPKSHLEARAEKCQVLLDTVVHLIEHRSVNPDFALSFTFMILQHFPKFSYLKLKDNYIRALKGIINCSKIDINRPFEYKYSTSSNEDGHILWKCL